MPKTSKQKTAACMVLAMHDGKLSKDKFPRVAAMMKTMDKATAEEMCHAPVQK